MTTAAASNEVTMLRPRMARYAARTATADRAAADLQQHHGVGTRLRSDATRSVWVSIMSLSDST